jgi:serine/threonine protein kinase
VLKKGPDWWVKISDFGVSKRIESTALWTQIGTEPYVAPEVKGIFPINNGADANAGNVTLAVDIWSVGVIAFRMVTGRLPFPDSR